MSGEVHFVFWNKKYGTVEAAMEKEDGLAVLAVFLKVRFKFLLSNPLLISAGSSFICISTTPLCDSSG